MNLLACLLIVGCVAGYASAQSPRTAEDYNNRGLERQNRGDIDGAIEDYTKALTIKDKTVVHATAYNNRANARLNKNDVDGAIADYGKAIELQPNNFENYYNRGIALASKHDYDLAIADFSKALEISPDFATALRFTRHGEKRKGRPRWRDNRLSESNCPRAEILSGLLQSRLRLSGEERYQGSHQRLFDSVGDRAGLFRRVRKSGPGPPGIERP